MYTFTDKGNREITLWPEGTASIARFVEEEKILHKEKNPLKYLYISISVLSSDMKPHNAEDYDNSINMDLSVFLFIVFSLSKEEKEYIELFKSIMEKYNIKFEWDKSLVRGLDYYTGIVFEIVSNEKNNTIIGGGKYEKIFSE